MVWIKNQWGTKIWKHTRCQRSALSARVSGQVAKVLSITAEKYKKRSPQGWPDSEMLSKTGTTNDARTCWFIGATPDITTAVYIGCDDNRPLGKQVYAVQTALPICKEFNRLVPLATVTKRFAYDPALKELYINGKTGQLCSPDDPEALAILVDPSVALRCSQPEAPKLDLNSVIV